MKPPKIVEVAELFRGGAHLARVVVEVDIADLPDVLGGSDPAELEHPNVRAALASSAAARERRAPAERPAPAHPPAPAAPARAVRVDGEDRVAAERPAPREGREGREGRR